MAMIVYLLFAMAVGRLVRYGVLVLLARLRDPAMAWYWDGFAPFAVVAALSAPTIMGGWRGMAALLAGFLLAGRPTAIRADGDGAANTPLSWNGMDDWLFEYTPFLKEHDPGAGLASRMLDPGWRREANGFRFLERTDIFVKDDVRIIIGHTTGLGVIVRPCGRPMPVKELRRLATRMLPYPTWRHCCHGVWNPDRMARAVMLRYGAWVVQWLADRLEERPHPWWHAGGFRHYCRPIIRAFRTRDRYPIRPLGWDGPLDEAGRRYEETCERYGLVGLASRAAGMMARIRSILRG